MAHRLPTGADIDPEIIRPAMDEIGDEKKDRRNAAASDPESQDDTSSNLPSAAKKPSAFKSLSWLDRYLAIWILLAIILGILLGNFAPGTAAALDRGRFVGVSVPIGMSCLPF